MTVCLTTPGNTCDHVLCGIEIVAPLPGTVNVTPRPPVAVRQGEYEPSLPEPRRVKKDPEPGDRIWIRNAAGGYLSDDPTRHRRPNEYTVHEVSPTLGVRTLDGWYPTDVVEVIGHAQPIHAPADPYVERLLDYRADVLLAVYTVMIKERGGQR